MFSSNSIITKGGQLCKTSRSAGLGRQWNQKHIGMTKYIPVHKHYLILLVLDYSNQIPKFNEDKIYKFSSQDKLFVYIRIQDNII
jgi:hypothetical protein